MIWIYKDGRNVNSELVTPPEGWILSNYGNYDSEIHDISGPAIVDGQAVYTITEKVNALAIVQEKRARYITDRADEELEGVALPCQCKDPETWQRQVAEAEAYTANPNAPTPLLTALVLERGNTIAAQAAEIIADKATYAPSMGTILGKHQNRLDQIYNVNATINSVRGVTWGS